jgi:GcrA cell cycle regulator
MTWTNDRIEQLKALWADGKSASVIAATLGSVTRNAIIGKIHRLGLPARATGTAAARPSRRSAARLRPRERTLRSSGRPLPMRAPRTLAHVSLQLGPAPEVPVTLSTLAAATCRWPEGDPAAPGFHFCGRPKSSVGPYCEPHASMAYKPAPRGLMFVASSVKV